MTLRPAFSHMWNYFSDINRDVSRVGNIIGGKVEVNINNNIFNNACALRMSYALNRAGITIPRNESRWKTSSGADKNWYIYRVDDMVRFLNDRFGKADLTKGVEHQKGVLFFNVSGWNDATGHVTLWNGVTCADKCYFHQSSGVQLWILK